MQNRWVSLTLIVSVALCYSWIAGAQCKVPFLVAARDPLGNVDTGFSDDDQKWFNKISKHYPDLCYTNLRADEGTWFYLDVTNKQDTAVVSGNTIVTRESTVFTLKIGQFRDKNLSVLRTFERVRPAVSGGTVSGLVNQLKNQKRDVLLDGMDWVEQHLADVAQQ